MKDYLKIINIHKGQMDLINNSIKLQYNCVCSKCGEIVQCGDLHDDDQPHIKSLCGDCAMGGTINRASEDGHD